MSRKRKPQSRRPGPPPSGRACTCANAPACGHVSLPEQRLAEAIWPRPAGHRYTQPSRPASADGAVWVRADLDMLTNTYRLTVEFNDHDVLGLDRDGMLAYVAALSDAMMRARYTEGVRRQLVGAGIDERLVLPTVADLREDWPELPRFGQFEVRPCVSYEGRCSVDVWHHGPAGDELVVQFAPEQLRSHIAHVLEVYAAADLDASYRRFLVATIDLDESRATAMIATLGDYLREE